MPQAIGTIIFVDYFMPQAIGTTSFVDYFMPQAIGTISFVDYFMPQAIGTISLSIISRPKPSEFTIDPQWKREFGVPERRVHYRSAVKMWID